MSQPVGITLTGYRMWRTREECGAYIRDLQFRITELKLWYRAIRAVRRPTDAERRRFYRIDLISDHMMRAKDDLRAFGD